MKKLLAVLLTFVLLFSVMAVFTGCESDSKPDTGNPSVGGFGWGDKNNNNNYSNDDKEDDKNSSQNGTSDRVEQDTEVQDTVVRYDLIDIDFAGVKVSDYEYNYIEFNVEDFTYYIENKTSATDILVKQTGTFAIDSRGNLTVTNDNNSAMNYLLYAGETAVFVDDKLYLSANIPGFGEASLTYQEQ